MMAARYRSGEFDDPLRGARLAVQGGRFRDAVQELSARRDALGTMPEWLLLMAMANWRLGEFASSHQMAEDARALFRTRGDTDGEMRAQNVAAAGAFARGLLDEASRGFHRALMLARQRSDKLMMARCANNLGNVAYHRGQNADAMVLYAQAANLFEQVGSLRGMTEAWHNTGIVWRDEGHLTAARRACERAIDAARQLGDDRLFAQALVGRGETEALSGDARLGRAHVDRAMEMARAQDDRLTECEALRVRAYIAREHDGAVEEATALAERALAIADAVENQWMAAKCREALGLTLAAAGDEEGAREAFEAAADAYRALGAAERAARVPGDGRISR